MPLQKNGVKMHQRMDSKQEDFLNLRLNLSMTKFMLNPREFPSFNQKSFHPEGFLNGLVFYKVAEAILFTQAVEMNWNFKIGAEINQINIIEKAVSSL